MLLLLLLLSPLAPCLCQSPCPPPWEDASLLGLGCLLFNSTSIYNWDGASQYCQTQAGSKYISTRIHIWVHKIKYTKSVSLAALLEIRTEAQLDHVRMVLSFLGSLEGGREWWTGGTDQGREGRWYWGPSLAPLGDFLWEQDYPDGGLTQNCAYLYSGKAYMAHDDPCYASYFPICQRHL